MQPSERLEQLIQESGCDEYTRSVIDEEIEHRGVERAIKEWGEILLHAQMCAAMGG